MSTQVSYRPPRINPTKKAAKTIAAAHANLLINADEWMSNHDRQSCLQQSTASIFSDLEITHQGLLDKYGDTARELLKIQALQQGVTKVNNLQALLENEHQDDLLAVGNRTSELLNQLQQGNVLLNDVVTQQNQLVDLIGQGHQNLVESENRVVGQLIGDTLATMGYEVNQRRGAMRGTKGKTCVWIEVDKGGDIGLDVSGFSGNSCQKEIQNIETRLAAIGLEMNQTASQQHGEEGGNLATSLRQIFAQQPERDIFVDSLRKKASPQKQTTTINKETITIGERK